MKKLVNLFIGFLNSLVKALQNGISAVAGLFKSIFLALTNFVKWIVAGFISAILASISSVKQFFQYLIGLVKKGITYFKPTYTVVFTMYHVIPGIPVQGKPDHHSFGKGEWKKAGDFYDKLVAKTQQFKIAPVEVQLIKGKKKILKTHHLGPVQELKTMKMSA
ncbi:MAG: hypothetical protein JJU28_18445 [Cyclobacteriaceae bacterium]|nr:hypothetical protein [Cyclobacteriaceae bacterium]